MLAHPPSQGGCSGGSGVWWSWRFQRGYDRLQALFLRGRCHEHFTLDWLLAGSTNSLKLFNFREISRLILLVVSVLFSGCQAREVGRAHRRSCSAWKEPLLTRNARSSYTNPGQQSGASTSLLTWAGCRGQPAPGGQSGRGQSLAGEGRSQLALHLALSSWRAGEGSSGWLTEAS